MKDKTTAALLALFLGWFGAHKFYLGEGGVGVLYLIFSWTLLPAMVGFIEGIVYLTMSDAAFNARYNGGLVLAAAGAPAPPQNIVVNVASTATAGGEASVDRIRALFELKTAGALTEEEFQAEKKKLLTPG